MSERATSARERLDAWRMRHADRLDPVRFQHMDALERRMASHDQDVRALLEQRLSGLMDAYAADIESAASAPASADAATVADSLGALARDLADHAVAHGGDSYPELAALGEFRQLWSRLRTESQLRQSFKQAPTDAGPLNSGTLVHRSIALMRDVSPGYLQHFVAYVDALSWMEQMRYGAPPATDAPRAPAAGRKRAAKTRARED